MGVMRRDSFSLALPVGLVVHTLPRLLYPFLTNSEKNEEGVVYRHPNDDGKERKGREAGW